MLYLGTEVGAFLSLDAGAHWSRFNLKNLPNVAVRDIFLQPERNDILLATHGRGLYILDDATPIQQLAEPAAPRCSPSAPRCVTPSAPRAPAAAIPNSPLRTPCTARFSITTCRPTDGLRIDVQDSAGKVIRNIAVPASERDPGLHRIAWDLRTDAPSGNDAGRGAGRRGGGGEGGREGGGRGEGGGGRGGAPRGAQVLPGVYTVKLVAGTSSVEKKVTVDIDPELKSSSADLQAQWTALEKISGMIRQTGDMLRESDRHADAPAWTQFKASLTSSGLAQQLQSLFTLIDGSNDAPTQAMRKLMDELQSDYDRSSEEFHKLN